MPTRTEVIQSLKSRDEFQNRDIATIMDYLEQESGNSSGTRATVVNSQRRVQDAVSPNDLTEIYNYVAELGTPASTLEAFLEDIAVRRDIVSLDLVNHILDLVDGASFPASQAAFSSCVDSIGSAFAHWPCNDASSPLVDRISARNVVEVGGPAGFLYQQAGPPGVLDIQTVSIGGGLRHFISTDVAFDTLFGANDSFSLFFIVNFGQDDLDRIVLQKGVAGVGQVRYRAEGINRPEFTVDDGTATELQGSSGTLFRNVWRTAAAVRDAAGNELRIYVDGLEVTPSPAAETGTNNYESTDDLTLLGSVAGNAADGDFSNIVLYTKALSDAEVLKLHVASGV
jgi:hypothetical protein